MRLEDASAVDTTTPVTPAVTETPAQTVPDTPDAPEPKLSMREGMEATLKAIRERPERVRDESGRFAPAGTDKAPERPAAAVLAPAPVQPAAAAPSVKPARPTDMPAAWGADKATAWTALPPDAKAYVAQREQQMEAFHANYAGLKPWQEAATANQTTLPEVLQRVHMVETAMGRDPSEGLVAALQMVGIEGQGAAQALVGALRRLGVNLGGQPQPAAQPNGQAQPQGDPRYDDLARRFETIQQTLAQQEMSKAQGNVAAFAADPANKFFPQVQDAVVSELKAMRALGRQPDLKEAYERALWTRPDIREQLVAEQVAAQVPAAVATRTQELDKSRLASRSVTGSPPTAEGRSSAERPAKLRDEIAMGVRNAMGRA